MADRLWLCTDGYAPLTIDAGSATAAAHAYVNGEEWGEETEWVRVRVVEIQEEGTDEEQGCRYRDCMSPARYLDSNGDPVCAGHIMQGAVEVRIDVPRPIPPCATEDDAHDWQSPYTLLGGLRDNPGVWGHGGGVVTREVCARCGTYRITDTWAHDPDTGEQGLRRISYADADVASLAWVRQQKDEA
jgi:hypothetical protein